MVANQALAGILALGLACGASGALFAQTTTYPEPGPGPGGPVVLYPPKPGPATPPPVIGQKTSESVELRIGHHREVRLNRAFTSVHIGDPAIIDIFPKSDRLFVVTAKKPGTTDILVFSEGNIHKLEVSVTPQFAVRQPQSILVHVTSLATRRDLHSPLNYECNPYCVLIKGGPDRPSSMMVDQGIPAGGEPVLLGAPPAPAPAPTPSQ